MLTKSRQLRSLPRIPKSRRIAVTRTEFDRVIDILNERGEILREYRAALDEHRIGLDQIRRDLEIQFKRIAQLQEEVDRLRRERR
jgi:hypothetical protein